MPTEHQPPGPQGRRTARLTGTVTRAESKLDLDAQLSIAYSQKWLDIAQGPSPLEVPASGVVRRALQVYMRHLNAATTDPADEARAALRCCNAFPANEETRQAAFARLDAAPGGQLLPPFRNVLCDPGVIATIDGLDAKVDELVDQISQQRSQRRVRTAP